MRLPGPHTPFLLAAAAVLLPALAAVPASPQADYPVKVHAEVMPDVAYAGEAFSVLLVFRIDPSYHIYGPMETEGSPTSVQALPAEGFRFGEPRFPPAKEEELFGTKIQVYEGKLLVTVPVTVAKDAKRGPHKLRFKPAFAACDASSCLPPVDDLVVEATVRVADAPGGGDGPGQMVRAAYEEPVNAPANAPAKGPANTPATGDRATGDKVDFAREVQTRGLLFGLLIGLGWGLFASLSPCVYPMIPVTLSFFGSQSGQSKGKTFAMACVYVLGIVLTFSILGLGMVRAGKDLGSIMAMPGVIAALGAVFVALAMSMFGYYEFRLPSSFTSRLESAGAERGGFLGAFILGLVLGLVAAPCVGPYAAAVLGYAATQPPAIGFMCVFMFGLGMGLPFLVLAVFSGSVPRPGRWMVLVKEFSGYVILGTAIYFMQGLVPENFVPYVAGVSAVGFVAVLGALSALSADASLGQKMLRGACLAVLLALALGLAWANRFRIPSDSFEGKMALAEKEHRPAYLHFTADW